MEGRSLRTGGLRGVVNLGPCKGQQLIKPPVGSSLSRGRVGGPVRLERDRVRRYVKRAGGIAEKKRRQGRKRQEEWEAEWEEVGSKCQSARFCLFVGFLTFQSLSNSLNSWCWPSLRAGTIQAIRENPRKRPKWMRNLWKKRGKKVGREEGYRRQRVVGALGVWFSIMGNRR